MNAGERVGFHFVGVEDFGQVFNLNQLPFDAIQSPSCSLNCQLQYQLSVICSRGRIARSSAVVPLLQPDAVDAVVARHVGENHRVAFLESFEHLDLVDRCAAHLDRNARGLCRLDPP